MTHARQQITTKECTRAKKGRPADISKISPGSVDKARCVVVCCDTMRFASCEALAMVNKNIVVQMEGFWRVCKASGSAVWHEWKWGWNAGGWGSKSYFEATCGATNAMECVDRRPSAARPSPAPQNPSLHPPSTQCRRSTNNTDPRTLRSAT